MWKWNAESADLDVPKWASFFDRDEYRAFIESVAADLHRRGDVVEIEQGVARLVLGDREEHRFGLQNLAQICHQAQTDDWPEIIKGHFDGVIRSSSSSALESLSSDWSLAQQAVKVRLYPLEAIEEALPGLAHRDVAEGLLAVLTYDLPEAVATVPLGDIEKWPVSVDEAFDLGLANVLQQDPVHEEEIELEGGGSFIAYVGDSFFVTSRMLAVDDLVPDRGDLGVLVAVPNRHTLLLTPITDRTVLDTLNAMLLVAHERYAEGPGSLTPDVFWYRGPEHELLPLRAEEDAGGLSFSPPEEFVETCLRQLPRQRSGFGPN